VSGPAADRYGAGQQGSFEGDRTDRGVREVRETEQAFRLTVFVSDEADPEIARLVQKLGRAPDAAVSGFCYNVLQ